MNSSTNLQSRRRRFLAHVNQGLSMLLRVEEQETAHQQQETFVTNVYHNPSTTRVTERQDEVTTATNPRLRELRILISAIPRSLRTHLSPHPLMARVRELIAELRAEMPDHIEEFLNDIINL